MTQAEEFESHMMDIWDGTLYDTHYDEWHDATIRARHPSWSATHTGRNSSMDNEIWAEYEFGDGSKAWIKSDGSSVYNEGQPSSSSQPY